MSAWNIRQSVLTSVAMWKEVSNAFVQEDMYYWKMAEHVQVYSTMQNVSQNVYDLETSLCYNLTTNTQLSTNKI